MNNLSTADILAVQACAKEDEMRGYTRYESTSQIGAHTVMMHTMYKLPMNTFPTLTAVRHDAFTRILQKEVNEGHDVKILLEELDMAENLLPTVDAEPSDESDAYEDKVLDVLTAYADWLGDLSVYLDSEMLRLGLDMQLVKAVIMASNFTKLGEDGQPIHDADGKFMKGPNFKAPEPTLRALIKLARTKAFSQKFQTKV